MAPPDAVAKLEAALADVERLLASELATRAAIDAADAPGEVRTLSAQLERSEGRLDALDNALADALAEYAEDAAELAIANARDLLAPVFRLTAALMHAGADTAKLRTLLDLADVLDVAPKPDPESDVAKLADRVRAAVAKLDCALEIVSSGGRRAS